MSAKKTDPGLKSLGQALQKLNELFALIRDTLAKYEVASTDLAAWLVGEGRDVFIADFLEPLFKRFQSAQQRVRTINKTTILVNLDADPVLPCEGAKVVTNTKGGWVKVQLRRDGHLYIDDKRMSFYLSDKQKAGGHKGADLRDELASKAIAVSHPNIMDALIDVAPHLIPEELKADEQGFIRHTYWWAVVYKGASGDLGVRCCCCVGGPLRRDYDWLDSSVFGRLHSAARTS